MTFKALDILRVVLNLCNFLDALLVPCLWVVQVVEKKPFAEPCEIHIWLAWLQERGMKILLSHWNLWHTLLPVVCAGQGSWVANDQKPARWLTQTEKRRPGKILGNSEFMGWGLENGTQNRGKNSRWLNWLESEPKSGRGIVWIRCPCCCHHWRGLDSGLRPWHSCHCHSCCSLYFKLPTASLLYLLQSQLITKWKSMWQNLLPKKSSCAELVLVSALLSY